MNCSNWGFNNQCNSGFPMGGCSSCNNSSCGCDCNIGCGCNPCQPCNPCNGRCPRPQPVVLPTQVQISKRASVQEQPVIVPIERRNINQCMYVPRFYPVVQNTFFNQL